MKFFKTILFLFAISFSVNAQHLGYFQIHNAPLQNNPSSVGAHADGRLIVNYQFGRYSFGSAGAFHAPSIGYDRAFQLKNGDQIGLGMQTFGTANEVNQWSSLRTKTNWNNSTNFLLAYRKRLGKGNHFLSGGVESGFSHFSDVNRSSLSAPDRLTRNFLNMAAGLNYSGQFKVIKKIEVGVALHDMVRIDISKSSQFVPVTPPQITAHAAFEFSPTKSSLVRSQVNFNKRNNFKSITYGAVATQYYTEHKIDWGLQLGTYLQMDNWFFSEDDWDFDRLILMVGIEFKKATLQYSQNFNIASSYTSTAFPPKHEISSIYKF